MRTLLQPHLHEEHPGLQNVPHKLEDKLENAMVTALSSREEITPASELEAKTKGVRKNLKSPALPLRPVYANPDSFPSNSPGASTAQLHHQ